MENTHISSGSLVYVTGNVTASADGVPDSAFVAFAVILTVIWIFGTYFNLVCIFVFLTNRELRTQTNKFIFALNTCDFLICSIDSPTCALSAWFRRWLWGSTFCMLEGFLCHFLVLTSMYIICYISFHRYMVVCRPVWVPKCLYRRDYAVCAACFALGCLWASVPLFGWSRYRLEINGVMCGPEWNTNNRRNMTYIYIGMALGLAVPFAVMIFSYCNIIIKIAMVTRKISGDKNSAIARNNIQMEKSIMLTCILIIMSFLTCWTPTLVVFVIHGMSTEKKLPKVVLALPPIIGKMQSLLDPVVYVSRNKQIRMAAYKWCCNNEIILSEENVIRGLTTI